MNAKKQIFYIFIIIKMKKNILFKIINILLKLDFLIVIQGNSSFLST